MPDPEDVPEYGPDVESEREFEQEERAKPKEWNPEERTQPSGPPVKPGQEQPAIRRPPPS
jgi:hypothetical protein